MHKSQISILILLLMPICLCAQIVEGTSYVLPKNGVRLTVSVEKTQYTPGQFCQYAERYLKEHVGQEATTTYRIIGIDAEHLSMPDTAKRFTLVIDKKHTIDKVSLTPDGRLLAINTDADLKPQSSNLNPQISILKSPTSHINPMSFLTEDILNAGSTAKMAELTAKEIYDIRDSRNALSRGEADNLPKDGAQLKLMYDNMDRQEQALATLFQGTTVRDTTQAQFEVWPTKEGRNLIFRFSKHYGLVDADDLSGEPYYADVTDLHTVTPPPPLTDDEKKKEDKADIGLRVNKPGRARIAIAYDGKTVKTIEMDAAQFGYVETLSGDLFGKKQTSELRLDPATGAVSSIEAKTVKN